MYHFYLFMYSCKIYEFEVRDKTLSFQSATRKALPQLCSEQLKKL